MIIVDFGHLSKRSVFANREAIQETPAYYAHTILTMLTSIIEKFGVSKHNPLILAIDSPSWRQDFYIKNKPNIPEYENKTYKGDRVKDTSINWDAIQEIESDVLSALKSFSDFHVIKLDNCEADDIIAVIAKNTKEQCIIISSDKDFQQLKSDNVSIYDPIKQIYIEPLDIDRFKKLHYMIGDKVDTILAIKTRMGIKTAEKCYHQLDELLALNPEMKQRYEFNQQMIDFDFIPEDLQKNILTEYNKDNILNFNGMKLMSFFMKYQLATISEKQNLFKYKDYVVETKLNTPSRINEYITNTLDDFFK